MNLKETVRRSLECNRGYAWVMLALDCSFSAARDKVKRNSDDLTKASMMVVLRKEFGLTDEEILQGQPEAQS
ncbi:MAG: hypothetical protein KGO82_12200 [Bacteroidota bacterium]|nr:hypothetical protein [Bacteroidota bacterium]